MDGLPHKIFSLSLVDPASRRKPSPYYPDASDSPKMRLRRPLQNSRLHKLPTEIRLQIFEYVLQAECGLIRIDMITDESLKVRCRKKRFNVALFSVCRKFTEEAQDAFSVVNVIRLRSSLLVMPFAKCYDLQSIRHLEVAGLAQAELDDHSKPPAFALVRLTRNMLRCLPKLRSITVRYDSMATGSSTIRAWLTSKLSSVSSIRCVALGRFEVTVSHKAGKGSRRHPLIVLYLENRRLRRILSRAKEIAQLHRYGDIFDAYNGKDHYLPETAIWRCAGYLKAYEYLRAWRAGSATAFDGLDAREKGLVLLEGTSEPVPCKRDPLPRDMKLADLIGAERQVHPKHLEWATEWLVHCIRKYPVVDCKEDILY